jgi:hypothetical protein
MRTALFSLSIFIFTFSNAQLNCKVDKVETLNYSDYLDSFYHIKTDSSINIFDLMIETKIDLDTFYKIDEYFSYVGSTFEQIRILYVECWDSFEGITNYADLEYDTSKIIIEISSNYPNYKSGYKYAVYGVPPSEVHAYIYENDSLLKFYIVSYELYYIDSIGNQKRLHPSSGNTITNQCKIVLSSIEEIEDTKNIYFQNVYLQDPNGNVLLFKEKRNLYDIHYKEKDDEE